MTTPSTLEARAADITTALQNYARDLEARLAVISRNPFVNPNDYAAMRFALPPADWRAGDVSAANTALLATVLERYRQGAGASVQPLDGHDSDESPLTDAERAAIENARALASSIIAVTSLSDASALVATFTV
ncbi:hypothetical protein [Leifsonia sp. P73]|uniref:hypothetical protein n=1 Tax=Leifsonia sp. P73 TaxID=3423959 RepID=UPI003DA2AB3F